MQRPQRKGGDECARDHCQPSINCEDNSKKYASMLEKNRGIIPGGETGDSSAKPTQNKWRKEKKRKQKIRRGKQTLKNLSDRKLSDSDHTLITEINISLTAKGTVYG